MIEKTILRESEWIKAFEYCNQQGLDVIFMPVDADSFDILGKISFRVKYFDLHSVSFNDAAVLDRIKSVGLPLIMATGGRTTAEIEQKVAFFGSQLSVLMTGFQSYPTRIETLGMARIRAYCKMFPGIAVGYADHTAWNDLSSIEHTKNALLLGATFFEKHIAVDAGLQRIDFDSAADVATVRKIKDEVVSLAAVIWLDKEGDESIFELSKEEIIYRNRERKMVATRNLTAGIFLTNEDMMLRMIDKPGGVNSGDQIIGRKLLKDVAAFDVITSADCRQE